jgi:GAF domain-containing protein
MGNLGAGSWVRDPPGHDAVGTGWVVQTVLEHTEAALCQSARRLRECGQEDWARQAERFASWARFNLDEPAVARQLYLAAARLRKIRQLELLACRALETVLSLSRAERGNVQLADPATGALRIVAQHGFGQEFLDHFAVVDDDRSACGRAARHGAQLVITDVFADPAFMPHREVAAASGFRAVQSTPLIDMAGRVVGVVSTHYPRPYDPPARDLLIIKRYADLVGQILASSRDALTPDEAITA